MSTQNPTPAEYRDKEQAYFAHANLHLAARIGGSNLHVFDVGCGEGALIRCLNLRGMIAKSYGVELVPAAAERAREVVSELWNESIESFSPAIPPHSLDYVICADVLEHLRDPHSVLLRLREYLKPQGLLLVSLPNASNRRLIWNLLVRNEWEYAPSGIMDATHLRWFTSKSARRLLEQSGFRVLDSEYVFWGKVGALVDKVSLGMLSRFVASQLYLSAQPTTSPV